MNGVPQCQIALYSIVLRLMKIGFYLLTRHDQFTKYIAGILEQSMGARNRVGRGFSYRSARAPSAGGIYSLESIPGLLKVKKYLINTVQQYISMSTARNKNCTPHMIFFFWGGG